MEAQGLTLRSCRWCLRSATSGSAHTQPHFLPDVDECAAETPPCSEAQYCENVNGSYICEGDQSAGTCHLHRLLSAFTLCGLDDLCMVSELKVATSVVDMQKASTSPRIILSLHLTVASACSAASSSLAQSQQAFPP